MDIEDMILVDEIVHHRAPKGQSNDYLYPIYSERSRTIELQVLKRPRRELYGNGGKRSGGSHGFTGTYYASTPCAQVQKDHPKVESCFACPLEECRLVVKDRAKG